MANSKNNTNNSKTKIQAKNNKKSNVSYAQNQPSTRAPNVKKSSAELYKKNAKQDAEIKKDNARIRSDLYARSVDDDIIQKKSHNLVAQKELKKRQEKKAQKKLARNTYARAELKKKEDEKKNQLAPKEEKKDGAKNDKTTQSDTGFTNNARIEAKEQARKKNQSNQSKLKKVTAGAAVVGTAGRAGKKVLSQGKNGFEQVENEQGGANQYAVGNLSVAKQGKKLAKGTFVAEQAGEQAITGTGIERFYERAKNMFKKVKNLVASFFLNPIMWIVAAVALFVVLLIGVLFIVVAAVGAADNTDNYSTYQAQVSEQTEQWRSLVDEYCEKYGIPDYVDLVLALIQQESSGNPPDVMQSSASYYNTSGTITTAEQSIDYGVHQFSDCLTSAGCKSNGDIDGISLALQGYNYGNGYISWALSNYGGYTAENAVIFSEMMCARLGYSRYGDTEYVPHVLRYYVENPAAAISNESAQEILAELEENNDASEDVWKVIEYGASLIGKVEYSMENRQSDGRDNPTILDCSSFAAWAFHKGGITSVGYSWTTTSFRESTKFVDIDASDLKVGDIGLKSATAGDGGENHIGIYCGKLKDGTKVWMHCTSSCSTSLTGNTSGAMFSTYTGFTYFRRLKKWD